MDPPFFKKIKSNIKISINIIAVSETSCIFYLQANYNLKKKNLYLKIKALTRCIHIPLTVNLVIIIIFKYIRIFTYFIGIFNLAATSSLVSKSLIIPTLFLMIIKNIKYYFY